MWAILLCVVLGLVGSSYVLGGRSRTATEIVADLLEEDHHGDLEGARRSSQDGLCSGVRRRWCESRMAMLVVGSLTLFGAAAFSVSVSRIIALSGIGLGVGYLWGRSRERMQEEKRREAIAFHLPLVMESVVMAVEAGSDVLGAIRRVVDLTASTGGTGDADPVTPLLRGIVERTDAGAGLEETLRTVAAESDVVAVRHAFLHLALAHREGGELIRPLRELGTSTQAHFQESIEERIAKLPVKATAPLLCTFAGLIICFITIPLVQVSSMTKRALPAESSPPRVGDRGAMTLFLAWCIAPVLFLLGTLALDLRAYTLESGAQQRILDDAVLEGARALPDSNGAVQVVEQYLSRFGLGGAVEVRATPRSIAVFREGIIQLSFAGIFGIDAGVPYSLYARARSRPVDAVIAVDLSRGLAPEAGTQWGAEGEWGAAQYFIEMAARYRDSRDARALTARCFNPILSALKLSAIRAFEYLDAFGDSRIGVGLYPGAGYNFQFIRPFGERGSAGVEFPRYEGRELRTEDCAGAAIEEHWFGRYRFPINRYDPLPTPTEPFLSPGGEFNQAYAPYLTVAEAVWSSPVREESPNDLGLGDLSAVLDGVLGALLGAPLLTHRGALGEKPHRLGLILTGDIPRVGAERFPSPVVLSRIEAVLERYRGLLEELNGHVQLFLLVLAPPTTVISPFERRAVKEFFSARRIETPISSLQIEPLFAGSEEELLSVVLPLVLLERNFGGLSR